MVVGSVTPSDPASKLELVVVLVPLVTDGKRAHTPVHQLAHQSDVHAGVDAAGKQHAERHVADHPAPYGSAQPFQQLIGALILSNVPWIDHPVAVRVAIPPLLSRRSAGVVDG